MSRVMGFARHWSKLDHIDQDFTTFRAFRKDHAKGREWHEGEIVQIVLHMRSKAPEREILGMAKIVKVEQRTMVPAEWFKPGLAPVERPCVTESECVADGFPDGWSGLSAFMHKQHGAAHVDTDNWMNKITLRWLDRDPAQDAVRDDKGHFLHYMVPNGVRFVLAAHA